MSHIPLIFRLSDSNKTHAGITGEHPQFCAFLWGDEPPSRRETHHHVSPRLCA